MTNTCRCKIKGWQSEGYWSEEEIEIEYCPLHKAAPQLVEALESVLCYFDEAKDDCGLCNKGIFMGHAEGCVILEVQAALRSAKGMEHEV